MLSTPGQRRPVKRRKLETRDRILGVAYLVALAIKMEPMLPMSRAT
jgi:hypothetical protein